MPVNMIRFGERLRDARRRAGLTQTQLAQQTKLDLSNLNDLEHGRKTGARLETLVALAEALGIGLDYLAGLTDNPLPPPRGAHPFLVPAPPRRRRARAEVASGS